MTQSLADYVPRIEDLGKELGLRYHPVEFELVPPSFMMEVAVYGLPVRMPHWSFGVRWIYQMVQHKMGNSKIFEVVFPGNPNRAYLVNSNGIHENSLVVAHVLGHADFSHNNLLFVNSQREAGYHIVEQAAAHAHRIEQAIEEVGAKRVEEVLDAALALEQHIDTRSPINRPHFPTTVQKPRKPEADEPAFMGRFQQLPGQGGEAEKTSEAPQRAKIPPQPEADLLWFIAHYGPDMEDWERDIFLAVREESYYFQPVFNCQIMNEGWACYWHARILREADFLPDELYLDAMKTHSDVVRPYAAEKQVALAVNPYHLGFHIWTKLIQERGVEAARRIMEEEDDFGFVRNYLDPELARDLDLFVYQAGRDGEVRVKESNIDQLYEAILAPKYNFGAPRVFVDAIKSDGSLVLVHDHSTDGRGLEPNHARHVLGYIHRVWRRPVCINTVDMKGEAQTLQVGRAA
ncbi:stage V sporulation protein R [Alkalilimnicola ehrlichii]|uniref:Stage V sporulation protein R n=1 Tax=Alkalilimnicola ehrlichii TaxID=351052 RepID=A0A3E0WGG1_9GAMM|nr:SpoVR family protein [Alkalilimnicola ehrlichii]RFA24782.1 stage V sporulation protein R [Alkalilimnicola ehrlichii]RFA32040.1 stage V sporulation protein R [Alkalilimnicola ehrlichii]